MQKKKTNIIKLIILIAIICLILLLLAFASNIFKLNKNKLDIAESISDEEIILNEPNAPVISAGMIPVKKVGDSFIITTKDDADWYNYKKGKPAYIMLNDGTYQSELLQDMTGKRLANDYIGIGLNRPEDIGSIYMWIPRFNIDESGKIQYLKSEQTLLGTPEMFIYETDNEAIPDYSLSGIYIGIDSNINLSNTIEEMDTENGVYGFIKNTKIRQVTETDINIISRYIIGVNSDINTLTNTNRVMLQVINTNILEPIKAKICYDTVEEKIKVEVLYSKNGIAKIVDENENILSENSMTAYIGDLKIDITTYTVIVYDNKNNQKKIMAKDIIPDYYGKLVSNYTCSLSKIYPDLKWRVFYKDNENIYLISDYYIKNTYLPATSDEAVKSGNNPNKSGTYNAYFNNLLSSYEYGTNKSGSAWIRSNNTAKAIADKWLPWVNLYPESKNSNMKAIAYMLDTKAWSIFAGEQAEYAIGGPTLEMYCASYKVTHPTKYIDCDVTKADAIGYKVKWSDDLSYSGSKIEGLNNTKEYNGIYITESSSSNAYSYWIASPNNRYERCIMAAKCTGLLYEESYFDNRDGFRPVVCIKKGIGLQKNADDETYRLVKMIEADGVYDENNNKINIKVTSHMHKIVSIIDDETGENIINNDGISAVKDVTTYGIKTFTIIDKTGYEIKIEVPAILITAKDVTASIYGAEVQGYTCASDGVDKWRIFYADNDNIYLIADDYVSYSNIPKTTKGNSLNKGSNDYRVYYCNDILNDYTGSDWIINNTNPKAQKWLTYINKYPNNKQDNIKYIAYEMDTNVWGSNFAGDQAEYAIAGPTLELFCASYNKTHPTSCIEYNVSSTNGYMVRWNNGSYAYEISNLEKDDYNKIYIDSNSTKAYGYRTIAPSACDYNYVMRTYYGGYLTHYRESAVYFGYRPLVCLKSNVKLKNISTGVYEII